MKRGNLYAQHPGALPGPGEFVEELLRSGAVRIERIHSEGHATPDGRWYDQDHDEWVALLVGSATLRFEEGSILRLTAGDWVHIPAHARHRVEETSRDPRALWLAIHLAASEQGGPAGPPGEPPPA